MFKTLKNFLRGKTTTDESCKSIDTNWFKLESLKTQLSKYNINSVNNDLKRDLIQQVVLTKAEINKLTEELKANNPQITDVVSSEFKKQEKRQIVADVAREKFVATYSFHPQSESEDVVREYSCEDSAKRQEYYDKLRQNLVGVIPAILDISGDAAEAVFEEMLVYLTRTNTGGLAYEQTVLTFQNCVIEELMEEKAPCEQDHPADSAMDLPFLKPIGQERSEILVFIKKTRGVVVRVASYFMTAFSDSMRQVSQKTERSNYFKTVTETVINVKHAKSDSTLFKIYTKTRVLIFTQGEPFWG